MIRKCIFFLLALMAFSASAQITFNTGSVQLDSDLNMINTRATANFSAFRSDLSLSFGVSRKKIDHMHTSLHMAPGEIYLAFELSKLSRVSIDRVITVYETNKKKGWGVIAKELGIKPGSPEFHQLKNNAGKNKNKGKGNSKSKGNGKGKSKKK
ncbi:hypothetical protein [Mangrovimonas futianensis]|uniref:hypothetical protein n=2 Tax=Mangrovimonas futianensis TaxID=2895523 RepID=UPI001E3DEB3B|nr:hypothetical protein [Mangrovimonas futianensis]MCF1195692.1 hypothetical protein [Mangrovimonas futianensis]